MSKFIKVMVKEFNENPMDPPEAILLNTDEIHYVSLDENKDASIIFKNNQGSCMTVEKYDMVVDRILK